MKVLGIVLVLLALLLYFFAIARPEPDLPNEVKSSRYFSAAIVPAMVAAVGVAMIKRNRV